MTAVQAPTLAKLLRARTEKDAVAEKAHEELDLWWRENKALTRFDLQRRQDASPKRAAAWRFTPETWELFINSASGYGLREMGAIAWGAPRFLLLGLPVEIVPDLPEPGWAVA